ncbi:hypothetical protein FOZ61_004497 [Perkinsus olseni]|nr:hypothetical protein FOZ61_004497 [Perkinsus olseni]
MQWIEAEHLKMLYSKEEVEQAFGNSLSEEKFVDNCREYASRVMPDRADVYHSSMEDIINELLNIAVMDTYAAKAGDGATAKDRTDYHGTKADSAEVTSINGVLAKCGLPTISPTEATVEELQTAVDCIQRLAAAESDNLLPADINTLRVVLRDKYLDRCQSDVNHAMAELQGITANPVSDTSRASFGRTSFFCNQKCFEDNWAEHSKLHAVLATAARIERERAKATDKTEATPEAAGWIPPFAGKSSESTAAATAAMREVITHRTALEERRHPADDSDDEAMISTKTKQRIKEFLDTTARRIMDGGAEAAAGPAPTSVVAASGSNVPDAGSGSASPGPQLRSRGASPSPTALSLTTEVSSTKRTSLNVDMQSPGTIRRAADQSFEAFLTGSAKAVIAFTRQALHEPRQLLAGLRPAILVLICMVALLIVSSGTSLHQLDRAADFLPLTLVHSAQSGVDVMETPILNLPSGGGDGVRARSHAGTTPLVIAEVTPTQSAVSEPSADVYKKALVNLAKMTGHEEDIDGLLSKAGSAAGSANNSLIGYG